MDLLQDRFWLNLKVVSYDDADEEEVDCYDPHRNPKHMIGNFHEVASNRCYGSYYSPNDSHVVGMVVVPCRHYYYDVVVVVVGGMEDDGWSHFSSDVVLSFWYVVVVPMDMVL
jgi:hypothetical protein